LNLILEFKDENYYLFLGYANKMPFFLFIFLILQRKFKKRINETSIARQNEFYLIFKLCKNEFEKV